MFGIDLGSAALRIATGQQPEVVTIRQELGETALSATVLQQTLSKAGVPFEERAVLSVPASTKLRERGVLRNDCSRCGVEIAGIVSSPVLAAMAICHERNIYGRIAVCDLGRNTFGLALVESEDVDGELQVEVLSTGGLSLLGGEDFDLRLATYCAAEIERCHGVRINNDTADWSALIQASEQARIELSSKEDARIAVTCGNKCFEVAVSRQILEGLLAVLIERMQQTCLMALRDCDLCNPATGSFQADHLFMVGGLASTPILRQKIGEIFNARPKHGPELRESPVRGANLLAKVHQGTVKDLLLLDVTPYSIGIEIIGGGMAILVDRNTTYPTKAYRVFTSIDDLQQGMSIRIHQGESTRAADNLLLGQFELEGMARLGKGSAAIDVIVDIDANGYIHLTAKDRIAGQAKRKIGFGSFSEVRTLCSQCHATIAIQDHFCSQCGARMMASADRTKIYPLPLPKNE